MRNAAACLCLVLAACKGAPGEAIAVFSVSDYAGTRLFANFTPEEQAAIKAKGKIPETARWADRAALDDLMTESFRHPDAAEGVHSYLERRPPKFAPLAVEAG